MNSILPYVIVGISVGSVYSLAGVGLVLTYKTSNIFNFAHGALATVAAFLFYVLWYEHNVPWPIAAVIGVLVLGAILGGGLQAVAARLSQVSPAWQIAATVGILLMLQSIVELIFGTDERVLPQFLPQSGFHLYSVEVSWGQLIILLISFFSTAALYVAFRVTRVGVAMRGVVEAPNLLALAGTSPSSVRRWAWVIGCTFAALSGLLLAPSVSLDPFTLTLLIVQAFGAAAIGNFSNLPLTWVGGIIIGVAGSVATMYAASHEILQGLSPALPFLVLFLVLLFSPRTRLGIRRVDVTVRLRQWRAPWRVQVAIGVPVLALLIAVPAIVSYHTPSYTLMLSSVLLFLSLGLLVRVAGQVSLCQVSFAAIGAVAFSRLAVNGHVPWLLAFLLAGLIVVPIGALLAIPAIRLGGLYLALATFGFGILLQDMFYQSTVMFGLGGASLVMPLPKLSWLDSTNGFYYLTLAITVVVAIGVVVLTRSRFGRLLRATADSPKAMVSMGNGVQVPLVVVFCVSAFLAALAGALQGMTFGQVSGVDFDPNQSLLYLAVILITVGSEPWYALIAAAGLILIPVYVTSPETPTYLELLFGFAAVSVALRGQPEFRRLDGLRSWLERFGTHRQATAVLAAETAVASHPGTSVEFAPEANDQQQHVQLEVRNVGVRFGGLVAVRDMSLTLKSGHVTGLIGPNGAGKTTLLNACSGYVKSTSGQILIDGRDVSRRGPSARARMGIGRSFQQMELCDSLTVWENVAMGREGPMAGANVMRQIIPRRHDGAVVKEDAVAALVRCGLGSVVDAQVGSLPSTQRRMVEIARCLAGPYRLLLLDEPSSGLDVAATARLGTLLREIAEERDVGILLVEHDMSLVMSVCSDIYVMEFGEMIMHGDPQTVQASEAVQAAYLGTA